MKKINLWLVRQENGKKWKWIEVHNNHPCRDLTKCVNECLWKEAKKRENLKESHSTEFDLVALFADKMLDERTLMMECASAIADYLKTNRGLKVKSFVALDDCDWVRWFTTKSLKRYFKELAKYQRKEEKKNGKRDD